jgi:hypothetical protein
MFKDVCRLVIAPFFDLDLISDDDDESESGQPAGPSQANAWELIGEEKTRGEW